MNEWKETNLFYRFIFFSQVMALHINSKYIHVGCDEVYHLGGCAQCQGLKCSNLSLMPIVPKKLDRLKNENHFVPVCKTDELFSYNRHLFWL